MLSRTGRDERGGGGDFTILPSAHPVRIILVNPCDFV